MIQDNDDIIELIDEVDTPDTEDQGIIELTDVVTGEGQSTEEPAFEAPLVLDTGEKEEEPGMTMSRVDREAFEAALERVIEKKFSETIEKILFEVMEKVIQREITDIKTNLQKDLDDIGRP